MITVRPWLISDDPGTSDWLASCLDHTLLDVSEELAVFGELGQAGMPTLDTVVYLDLTAKNGAISASLQKTREAIHGAPLIALVSDPDDGVQALEKGADDYLIPAETDGALFARATRYARERQLKRPQHEQEPFRLYLESAPDIIFVLDLQEKCITYFNRDRLFGYSAEMLARPGAVLELIHDEDHGAVLQHWRQLSTARPGDVFIFEYRLRPKDGEWEWVQSRETVLSEGDDRAPRQILVSLSVITHRREREAAVRRYAERLQILHEIDQAIVAARSPQTIAQATLRHITRLVSCRRASVVIFNWDQETFTITAELPEGSMGHNESSLPLDWFWALDALKQGELYRADDIANLPPESQTQLLHWLLGQGVQSLISVPLLAQRKLIGAVNFGAEGIGSFSSEDIVVMREVAHVLAIGISQARLYEQAHYHARKLEQRAKRLLLVNDLSLAVNRPVNLNAVLEAAARGLVQVIDLRQVGIVLLDESRDFWSHLVSHSARHGGSSQQLKIAVHDKERMRRLLHNNRPVLLDDARRQLRIAGLDDLLLEHRLDSLMVVPLQVRDEIIGVIGCDVGPGARPLSREETDLVQTIANLVAIKVEHIRLLDAERSARSEAEAHAASLRQRERHLTLLNGVTRATTGLQMDEMLQTVVDRLGESSDASGCYIALWDETQQQAVPAAAYGPLRESYATLQSQPGKQTLTHAVLQEGKAIQITSNQKVPYLPPYSNSELGPESALAIPLIAGKENLGALIISHPDPHEFSSSEFTLYEQAASQIALALSAARLFEETRRRAEELEVLGNLSASLRVADGAEEIMSSLLSASVELFNADVVAIMVPDEEPGMLALAQSHGVPEEMKPVVYEIDGSIAGHVFTSGQPYRSDNILDDQRAHRRVQEAWRQQAVQAQTAIYAPLQAGRQVTGVVSVLNTPPHNLEEADLGLLTAMAEITGSALHRAGLMETLEQRVEERTRELAEANEQLQELDRLKSKFVSDVSHELRTPITSLSLYLDLIERAGPERSERYWTVLRKQTERLNQLIEDILSLSRLQMGRVDVTLAPNDLNEIVAEVLDIRRDDFSAAGLALSLEVEDALPVVSAQPDLLVQVVNNLLSNALSYTPEGSVDVRTFLDAARGMACISIADSGIGIAADELPHIFERFYRGLSAGQSNIPGTGLGLTIVEEIISLHQGDMEVISEEGLGTTFRVYLPLATEPEKMPQ